MSGWLRYLKLTAKSRTGLSGGLIIWAMIAAISAVVTGVFAIFAAFIFLAGRYDPLTAALVLFGIFLLLTIIALVCCVLTQRRTIERAKVALATRSAQPWFDPKLLALGLQIGRGVGWRKLVPLAAAALLAGELARGWFSRHSANDDAQDDDDEA